MAQALFNAKITISNSVPTADPFVFVIDAEISDAEGLFSGIDVSVGNCIILDTAGAEPGTVSRYRVTALSSKSFGNVTCTVAYDDEGNAIDPLGGVGVPGFICDVSRFNGLPWSAANDTQGFAQKLVTYANNISMFHKLENRISENRKKFTANGDINKGRLLRKSDLTHVVVASTDTQQNASVYGISISSALDGEELIVQRLGPIPNGLIEADDFIEGVIPEENTWVYLADEGKMSVTSPAEGRWSVFVGLWVDGTLDLNPNYWGIV